MKTQTISRRLVRWYSILIMGFSIAFAGTEAAEPPNVVLIISDDQAWTDYSFMGHPHVQTPRLDQLASQSLLFRRGYVTAPLCCPSLASILTGQYAHQHKITSNDPPLPEGMKPAEFHASAAFRDGREIMNRHLDNAPALTRLLGERGYVSFQAGKWWQGDYKRGGFTEGMTRGQRHGDDGLKIGRETLQPIFDFMDRAQEQKKPFFVWYAPMMPHSPHTPPANLLAKYQAKTNSLHVARYWAMIEWFDQTCGQLLDRLEERKLATNTIVVYVTDNGWIQDPDSPRFAPRSKQTPYEGGVRTPIMIRWPGKVLPQDSPELASSIDIAPTILELIGARRHASMPGLNLTDPAAVAARNRIFGAFFTHNAVDLLRPERNVLGRWVVRGNWKLIARASGAPELFNLSADPFERKNLAETNAELVQKLQSDLDRWWNPR